MAAIPTQVRAIIESLLDNVSEENVTPQLVSFDYLGWRWKCSIEKSQENEVKITIRRQKRS